MTRRILQRTAEIATFPNVIQTQKELKGRWNIDYFKNNNPVILELGCGKGEYSIELSLKYPQKNFIGIDNRSARIWKGAKTALTENIANVAFLNINIQDITDFFDEQEITEIWIPFPDPYPKIRHSKHRLTSPRFLDLYRKILKNGGLIHLKTDDWNLFNYSKEIIIKESGTIHKAIEDLYNTKMQNALLYINTTYERRYLKQGRIIRYLCFSL